MAPTTTLFPLLLLLLLIPPSTKAQTPSAPAPSSGTLNLTGILDRAGQFNTLMKILNSTQVGSQIEEQVKHSDQGLTLFAPTDNAFNNLKSGTINNLSPQQQVQLILAHVLPKFYRMSEFTTVSNPVRTQASTDDGKQIGINIFSQNNQMNVSTGLVETQVNNAIRQEMPLAVYQVDKVLLPEELFGAKSPSPANAPSTKSSDGGSKPKESDAKVPAASEETTNAAGRFNAGLCFIAGVVLLCMRVLV